MSNIQYINFDSLNGSTYNTSNQNNSYTFNISYASLSPNAFNATFQLQNPLHNISKIHLKSIELPIGWNNVRASSKLNIIGVAASCDLSGNYSNVFSISLADKTYTSVSTLIADINSSFLALYPTINIIFSLVNGYISVSSTSSIFTTKLYVVPTNLAYVLGFRKLLDVQTTGLTTASCVYNLNVDNYINLYISNISSTHSNNANGVLCHFKIITNAVNGVVYYASENNSYSQSINVNYWIPINNLCVSITDRFGYSINSCGLDYSFTLGFSS